MKHYPLRYLAGSVPMPSNLWELDSYVQSLRSSLSNGMAERSLPSGTGAVAPYEPLLLSIDPIGIDLSKRSSVKTYLQEIIAPHELQILRQIWEDVTPVDLEDASESVMALNKINPSIAFAAMQFDFSALRKLAQNLDDSEKDHIESLIPQLLSIAILGHVFHFARTLANQLHTPTGLPALDRIDYDRSHDTLKVGTVCDHFSNDLELAQLIISAYTPSSELDGACGYKDAPRLNAKTSRRLRMMGLHTRAHAELGALQKAHGQDLERILDQTVEELSSIRNQQLPVIEKIKAKYHYNKIFGNIGRTSPTVLLYIVIERAFSFLVAPPQGVEWPPERAALMDARSSVGNVTTFKVNSSPSPQQRLMIDNLFGAYRLAVLGDNEAIPVAARKRYTRNFVASSIHDPKRHRSRKEAPASFKTIMKTFRNGLNGSKPIDTEAKREASRLQNRLIDIPPDVNSAHRFLDRVISLYI